MKTAYLFAVVKPTALHQVVDEYILGIVVLGRLFALGNDQFDGWFAVISCLLVALLFLFRRKFPELCGRQLWYRLRG